jgi:Tfp pilus assembly protein PilF
MRQVALIATISGVVLLAGCQSEPMRAFQSDVKLAQSEVTGWFGGNKGDAALAAGLKQYEDGNYGEAAKQLQTAIDRGLSSSKRVNAHKHLAFIHCVSGRTGPCREEFRKALAVDPNLQLSAAEAGHPTWGPVFRSVKAGR